MQKSMPMQPQPPAMNPATGITTEQIQKYLDENKQLILAILENQKLGKLEECAQYETQLQKNLLYLDAIVPDAQPEAAESCPQMAPPGASPGVGQYMSQVPMFPQSQTPAAVSKLDAGGAASEPSGTESHRSTGGDNDGGSN